MDSPNSVEFTMKKKEDHRTVMVRAMIFVSCFASAVLILAIVAAVGGIMFMPLIPAVLILAGFVCWYCLRFTKIEYEYVILSGEFTIAAIYDNRSRKDLIKNAKIKDMLKVVPYHTNERLLEAPEIAQVLYYCSELANPDLYIAIFEDDKKGRVGVVFNTNRKLVQIMSFYNKLNVIIKNDFQF